MPGAQVSVFYTHPRIVGFIRSTWIGNQIPRVETDEKGRFNLTLGVKPKTPFRIEAKTETHLPVFAEPMIVEPGGEIQDIRLQLLSRGIKVVVRVVDAYEQPLDNVFVLFQSRDKVPLKSKSLPAI